MTEYTIRPYTHEDRGGFLSLYRTVMGRDNVSDWFTWKYEDNPYVDHVPIFVATNGGELVGARSFFALPLSIGHDEVALQPCDTMVHPDHRRKGLFTRMTEQAIDRYEGTHPFFYNFPNERSKPGNLKLGWEIVSDRSEFYRIQHPGAVAASRTDAESIQVISRLVSPLLETYHTVKDMRISNPSHVTVRVERQVPPTELSTLYRRSVPEEIHVERDEQFYEWRFGNPNWECTTYIAETEDEPRSAIVTGQSKTGGVDSTLLAEILPLKTIQRPALTALLRRIVVEDSESDIFVAPTQSIPRDILSTFSFHSGDQVPLSYATNQTTHVVRGLDGVWEVDGKTIFNPDNWHMTFVEYDLI